VKAPADLVIRAADVADAQAITEIYNEAIATTTATFDTELKSVDDRRRWLEEHTGRHPVIVAMTQRNVVGYASLTRWSDRCAYDGTAETSFYVRSSARNRGIGRALKLAIIEEARRLGYHTLLARVAAESEVSAHLNRACGFELVGTMREVGYKFGRRLDVHLFQIMLRSAAAPTAVGACGARTCS